MKELELRMYFFVPYNLSPIQQAIQAGHAALEYARRFGQTDLFKDFVKNWKTWIVLDGGTTNSDPTRKGTMQEIWNTIDYHNDFCRNEDVIHVASFYEPDINDAMTAMCFIVDERVFNKEDYPDWKPWVLNQLDNRHPDAILQEDWELEQRFPVLHKEWLKLIGGKKNEFLKKLLIDKKLA